MHGVHGLSSKLVTMMLTTILRWAMCSRTPGCVYEDGHGGACKTAKGF